MFRTISSQNEGSFELAFFVNGKISLEFLRAKAMGIVEQYLSSLVETQRIHFAGVLTVGLVKYMPSAPYPEGKMVSFSGATFLQSSTLKDRAVMDKILDGMAAALESLVDSKRVYIIFDGITRTLSSGPEEDNSLQRAKDIIAAGGFRFRGRFVQQ